MRLQFEALITTPNTQTLELNHQLQNRFTQKKHSKCSMLIPLQGYVEVCILAFNM
jgi:hypothetical protein